ncbi:hypothetical protein Tco_1148305 [Tanacetum coccineum]
MAENTHQRFPPTTRLIGSKQKILNLLALLRVKSETGVVVNPVITRIRVSQDCHAEYQGVFGDGTGRRNKNRAKTGERKKRDGFLRNYSGPFSDLDVQRITNESMATALHMD